MFHRKKKTQEKKIVGKHIMSLITGECTRKGKEKKTFGETFFFLQ